MNLQLFFYNPDLWWLTGMGKQSLYNVHITVDVENLMLGAIYLASEKLRAILIVPQVEGIALYAF